MKPLILIRFIIAMVLVLAMPGLVLAQKDAVELVLNRLNQDFERVTKGDTALQQELQMSLTEARALGSPVAESKGLLVLGLLYQQKGDFAQARRYLLEAAEVRERTNDVAGLASVWNNLGVLEHSLGNYSDAIDYAERALSIRQKLKDLPGLAASFTNIGNIYESSGLLTRALESHQKALELYVKSRNSAGQAGTYSNLGNIYKGLGKKAEALNAYNEAVSLYKAINDEYGLALVLSNLAALQVSLGASQAAIDNALAALKIRRQLGQDEDLIHNLLAVAEIFLSEGNVQVCSVYLNEAFAKADQLGSLALKVKCYKLMSALQARLGNWDKAFIFQLQYSQLSDSLMQQQGVEQLARLENQYTLELKENQILRLRNQQAKAEKKLLEQDNKLLATRLWLVTGIVGLVLMGALISFYIRANRKQEKLNAALQQQTHQLAEQNHLIQEKNKAIIDSIEYASQLQTSLQADQQLLKNSGLDIVTWSSPRDIVSGDFHWSYQDDYGCVYVIADCVGHGVRGAMLTMYGQVLLNELVTEVRLFEPHHILSELDKRLSQQFHQAEGMATGQMEMAVFIYQKGSKVLQFASSRIPLFAVTATGIETIKSGNVALGNSTVMFKEFPSINLPLHGGVLYCICSDGVADQFGGPDNRKYTRKQLRAALETIRDQNLEGELTPHAVVLHIQNEITNWKGSWPQTDDIIFSAIAAKPEQI